MTKEELQIRKKEINKVVNLLATFGDHNMTEKELLRVHDAYRSYYKILLHHLDLKVILNNFFLSLAGMDLLFSNPSEQALLDVLLIIGTGMIDKYLLNNFMDDYESLEEDRTWIKRFKASKNKEPKANHKLIQKLMIYQDELEEIKHTLKQEKGKEKLKK